MMKSLIASKTQSSGALIVRSGSVPRVVTEGVMDVLATFPGGIAQSDEDRARNLRGYLDAVEGVPQAVVMWVLKYLRFHNPRCTPRFVQPPFAQDVHELCQAGWAFWQLAVAEFAEWGTWRTTWTPQNLCCEVSIPLGPKPNEEGCLVPHELTLSILTENFQTINLERADVPFGHPLVCLNADVFAWIPLKVFPAGVHQTLVERREKFARAEAAAADARANGRLKDLMIGAAEWEANRSRRLDKSGHDIGPFPGVAELAEMQRLKAIGGAADGETPSLASLGAYDRSEASPGLSDGRLH